MSIFGELVDWLHHLIDGGAAHPHDLADIGIRPSDVHAHVADAAGGSATEAAFPNPAGDPVMDQVNASVSKATEAYHEGMNIAADAPHATSAGEQAQEFIHGVMNSSPEQLSHTQELLGGMNASEHIDGSVLASEQHMADSNAAHEAIRGADQGLVYGQSVSEGADATIDGGQA